MCLKFPFSLYLGPWYKAALATEAVSLLTKSLTAWQARARMPGNSTNEGQSDAEWVLIVRLEDPMHMNSEKWEIQGCLSVFLTGFSQNKINRYMLSQRLKVKADSDIYPEILLNKAHAHP